MKSEQPSIKSNAFAKNRPWLLLLLLGVVFIFVYAYTLDHKLDLNGDNANYITCARNMADGLGYSVVGPNGVVPAQQYPPGYSAILSVAIRLGLDNLLFFKCLNGFFLFASIALLFLAFGRLVKQDWLSFSIAGLLIMSPLLLHFAGMAMSEMSYLFCVTVSMVAMLMYHSTANKPFYKNGWFYLIFVAAVGSYYIRSVGTSIIFALLVFFLFRKEWKQALVSLGGVIILVLPWVIRNKVYGIQSRYFGTIMTVNPWRPDEGTISSFSEMWHKMITNLDETVIRGFKEVLFPFLQVSNEPSSVGGVILGVILVLIIFYGAWNMKTWRWMMLAFIIANMGIFALWHGGNGTRYVTPIVPVLYFCFYYGIWSLIARIPKLELKEHSLWALVLLLMVLPMRAPVRAMHEQSNRPYPTAYKNYFKLAKQIEKSQPQGTVVACRKPELFHYYAPHICAVHYKYDRDAKIVIQDMLDKNVSFVILDQLGYSSTALYLYPAIQAYPQLFPVVDVTGAPQTYLLKLDTDKARQL